MSEPVLRGQLREDEPMGRHVSWRAGGAAERAYVPADLADLQAFLRSQTAGAPIYFVGLGSNLLVRDGGLRGTVVFMHRALRQVRIDVARCGITAEAGVACPKLARIAAVNGCGGAEFFAGIPGTLGGALAMNAGCYGAQTWDVVTHVQTIDREGSLHERTPADFEIGYRSVILTAEGEKRKDGKQRAAETVFHPPSFIFEEWFVAATLRFARGDSIAARLRIKELLARRIATQPLNQLTPVPARNPRDYAASDRSLGSRGRAIGGALISPMHAISSSTPAGAGCGYRGVDRLAQRS
jgi:UDP-N-acetylmuramate dehydrogenase